MTRHTFILAAALCAATMGCERAQPGAPAQTPPPVIAATPPPPRPADPKAARAQNRLGMGRYKAKDYTAAAAAFRAALAADPGHVLAHYNLACVLALTGNKAGAIGELEWLSKSPDAAALRILVRGNQDTDLNSLREEPRVKALLDGAAERALFIGFHPLARGGPASEAEKGALDEGEDHDGAEAVHGEVVKARAGLETLVASIWDAKLLDHEGAQIASADFADGYGFGNAKSGGVDSYLGQVVADEEPEIVLHSEWTGRRVQGSTLLVLKRKGKKLLPILNLDLYASVTDVPEDADGNDDYEAATGTESFGEVELLGDGRLRRRTRGDNSKGKKEPWKTEILRWDPRKFTFVTEGAKARR